MCKKKYIEIKFYKASNSWAFCPLTRSITVQLKIEDASRRLRTGDLGIPLNPEDRFEKLLLQINGKNSSFTLPTA